MITIMLCWVFLFACGSSKQSVYGDDSVNIDDLLRDDNVEARKEKSNDEEVLRLLGIKPEEETVVNAEASIEEDKQVQAMQTDLERLKEDLAHKDQEISELKAELTEKEMAIGDLQAKTEASKSAPKAALGSRNVGEPSADFEAQYRRALERYRSRDYATAMEIFSELIYRDPNTTLSDNCQYWVGECYFALLNYDQAVVEFEKVFSFPNSNKSDDALLKLGVCYVKLGDREQARAEFSRLISTHPDSEYGNLARKYLKEL